MTASGRGFQVEAVSAPSNPKSGSTWGWNLIVTGDDRISTPVQLAWKWIPPGIYRRGARGYYPDEEPMHDVELTAGFWMLETPVTQEQWLAVMGGENPSYEQPPDVWRWHPVEHVTWFMARDWCRALQNAAPPVACVGPAAIGLPSEAMWEHACRAGSRAEYANGDGEECLDRVGWYAGNSGGRTHPVKEKEPNAWGLYDTHGNVWEWCRGLWDGDAYEKFLETGEEPDEDNAAGDTADSKDENAARALRPMRGGYCANPAVDCRSACRFRRPASLVVVNVGFRACLLPGPVRARKP